LQQTAGACRPSGVHSSPARTAAACSEGAGGLHLPQQQIYHPTAADVFAGLAAVRQDVGVVADGPSRRQVRDDRRAVPCAARLKPSGLSPRNAPAQRLTCGRRAVSLASRGRARLNRWMAAAIGCRGCKLITGSAAEVWMANILSLTIGLTESW